MYRGIVPPILVEAPKRAVKFAANSAYQPLFAPKNGGPLSRSGAVGAGLYFYYIFFIIHLLYIFIIYF